MLILPEPTDERASRAPTHWPDARSHLRGIDAAAQDVQGKAAPATPLLRKAVGEGTPGDILKQLDDIGRAEAAFTAMVSRAR